MPDPLTTLLAKRDAILHEFSQVGDMRQGSITETFRPCGKPRCCCAAPRHPGHGPYYAFTRKVEGKTQSLQLRPGPRLARIQREVDAYRRFRSLTEQLLEVNQAICDARPQEPATDTETAILKKTLRGSSTKKSRRR